MMTDTQEPQPLQPAGAPTQGTDPNPTDPSQGSADQKQQQAGLTDDDKALIMQVIKETREKWAMQRRMIVRKTLRRIEYLKGNQYISFDPYNFVYYDPFEDSSGTGSATGEDSQRIYHYVTNVVQWLTRVFVSSLSAAIPATRFWPGNAESDLDNDAAQHASKANALIERQNKARAMLKQALLYLGVSGCYFRYTRWVFDSRLGTKKEPIHEMQNQTLGDDHYFCPQCGAETPAAEAVMQTQPTCVGCGAGLDDTNFYPATSMEMPVITGMEDVPQGQVRQGFYNSLHVDVAPYADESGANPLINTPLLDLSMEIDKAALRAMYPDDWEMFGTQAGDSAGSPDADLERLSRLRAYSPGSARGLLSSTSMPTYSRTWLQPWAFNQLDDKTKAAKFNEMFQKGCCVASVNGHFLDVRPAILTEEWTWCGTTTGLGAYPPAVLEPAMDFQDRINDAANTEHEYYDRLASPPILYNPKMISKALNGRYLPAGSLIPVPVKMEMNQKMSDAFFQPKFDMDKGIGPYLQNLLQVVQLLIGVTPQMYGGTQENIDTASGQEQALKVATGIMWLYWDEVREEHAQAAKIAVKCLAKNADGDTYNIVEGDDGQFTNDPIDLEALEGEFECYPEADQGYPIGFQQMRELLQNMLIQGAKNPIIMEMFEPMKNRRLVARYLAPQDMEIPGDAAERKCLADLAKLVKGAPIPQPPQLDPRSGQPMQVFMPGDANGRPVIPDKDLDDLGVSQQTTMEYAQKNYKLADENPPVFENIRAYYRLVIQFQRQKQIQEALPPGGGPPQLGDGGGPPEAPPSGPPSPVMGQGPPTA